MDLGPRFAAAATTSPAVSLGLAGDGTIDGHVRAEDFFEARNSEWASQESEVQQTGGGLAARGTEEVKKIADGLPAGGKFSVLKINVDQ